MAAVHCNHGRGQAIAQTQLEAAVKHVDEYVGAACAFAILLTVGSTEHEAELLDCLSGGDAVICTEVSDSQFPHVRLYVFQLVLLLVVAPGLRVFSRCLLAVGVHHVHARMGVYAGTGRQIDHVFVALVGMEINHYILRILL